MPTDEIRGRKLELIAIDEAEAIDREVDRVRAAKLAAAKRAALEWLDRGDPAGCLVKFVAETLKPVIDGGEVPIIDWTRAQMLLDLGKNYLPPAIDSEDPEWRFKHLIATQAAQEGLRRWVDGFR